MRCEGPFCCPPVECAELDGGAGDGRVRKLSPPGMRRDFECVCLRFAILGHYAASMGNG